jgi:1-deoxy-D-xylulose-5-phosphate reductoisomerase
MKNIAVFGSTGSIGKQTLSVCEMHAEAFRVHTLVFGKNYAEGIKQIEAFRPECVGVFDELAARIVREKCPEVKVVSGSEVWELAAAPEVDTVVNGVSGFDGIFPLLAALRAGKRVALANKESVVCAGDMVRDALKTGGEIVPVDSEQSAIFQCLSAGKRSEVKRLILTASGGAFLNTPIGELEKVTPEMAARHPNWSMGRKITIDSATMFNKGLEVMEAAFLFDASADEISVLIHPQSIVHSMVEFCDNSVMAQLAAPDMRLAIQYALTYPERTGSPSPKLDLAKLSALTFMEPDEKRFPALPMAYHAFREGGSIPLVYNSANEAAVERFIRGEIRFTDIAPCVEYALERAEKTSVRSMEELLYFDKEARRMAYNYKV